MNELEIIEIAAKQSECDYLQLARLSGFSDEEIKFVKIFWGITFSKSWMYVSKEIVTEWLGYKDGSNVMGEFHRNLIKFHNNNIDYKQVGKNHEIILNWANNINNSPITGIHNKKYYVITGQCLKHFLISAQTQRGKFVRNIYLKTENLVLVMAQVIRAQESIIHKNELLYKDKLILDQTLELDMIKSKSLAFKSEVIFTEKHNTNGFIYINTTEQYSQYNIYRIGRTEKLVQRQKQYEMGRISTDAYYYVFTFETECVEILETIILKFLNKYKENSTTRKDLFVMNLNVLKPMVENICLQFRTYMIPTVNEMIEANLEEMASRDPKQITEAAAPVIFAQEVVEGITIMPKYKYYNQLLAIINEYPDVELVTPEKDIVHSKTKINIICTHANREVQTTTILTGGIGCIGCLKDKRSAEKIKALALVKLENFDNYDTVALVNQITPEFIKLKISEQKRIITQNNIVALLETESSKLVTIYKTMNDRISHVCIYGHTCETTWWSLKKLDKSFCKTCKLTQADIKEATIRRHITEEELIAAATAIGWKHIKKILIRGLIEWQCPNGHTVQKVQRELKRGFCAECKVLTKI